jgi:hypothetical protein
LGIFVPAVFCEDIFQAYLNAQRWPFCLPISAAFFILLSAATGAGIIAPYLGFTANYGSNHRSFAIREIPDAILFPKLAQFMVNLKAFIRFKRGLEFDGAGLIVNPPLVGV